MNQSGYTWPNLLFLNENVVIRRDVGTLSRVIDLGSWVTPTSELFQLSVKNFSLPTFSDVQNLTHNISCLMTFYLQEIYRGIFREKIKRLQFRTLYFHKKWIFIGVGLMVFLLNLRWRWVWTKKFLLYIKILHRNFSVLIS